MIIKIKLKMFYLIRKTKTVEFWCRPSEDFTERFITNNKIGRITVLKSEFIVGVPNVPHYRKIKI